MFKPTSPLMGGLLWKIPWRLSSPQKARQRKRLRAVDRVVDTLSSALARQARTNAPQAVKAASADADVNPDGAAATKTMKSVERWQREMPREEEMLPRDKYTIFDRKYRKYRKGIHKLPKWTRVSQRLNPPGF